MWENILTSVYGFWIENISIIVSYPFLWFRYKCKTGIMYCVYCTNRTYSSGWVSILSYHIILYHVILYCIISSEYFKLMLCYKADIFQTYLSIALSIAPSLSLSLPQRIENIPMILKINSIEFHFSSKRFSDSLKAILRSIAPALLCIISMISCVLNSQTTRPK